MPRHRRVLSDSNTYHIMIRGNERKDIFYDDEDRYKLLNILKHKKDISQCEIYAYCLMSNHVHLLVKENTEAISKFMKRVNVSYAYYFNRKYNRIGHVFQDRFKSEPIEGEAQLLAAIRYIHNNPVKAKLVNDCADYNWSSYKSYVLGNSQHAFLDHRLVLSIFSQNIDKGIQLFKEFSFLEKDDEGFIETEKKKEKEISIRGYLEAKRYIEYYLADKGLKTNNLQEKVNVDVRNDIILKMKTNSDLSIREIADILTINRGIVGRIKG
ncbi:REP-associated tyrosine transposase [Anaerosolibacter sp.]|uniref:REP-associated tyrosine transposase n=1 Tax=Anaerosolibacter sp. TaxID=1872527 RepID=UPI0039EEBFA3